MPAQTDETFEEDERTCGVIREQNEHVRQRRVLSLHLL